MSAAHPFTAEVRYPAVDFARPGPSADLVAGLQNRHCLTNGAQAARRTQTGQPGADNRSINDVQSVLWHETIVSDICINHC